MVQKKGAFSCSYVSRTIRTIIFAKMDQTKILMSIFFDIKNVEKSFAEITVLMVRDWITMRECVKNSGPL